MAQNLLEGAVVTPLAETLVNSLPRPKALWKIPPFGARARYPEDAVKHLTIIAPWASHALRRGDDGFDHRPTQMRFHIGLP